MDGARKRRKWDVASPAGMTVAGNRAGIGAGSISQQGLSGFITAQGHQVPSVPMGAATSSLGAATSQTGAGHTPNQSVDQATIARAQQGAQAIVERINAELRAKGQLPALRGQGRFYDDTKEIAREVIINDAPPPIRYNLTKRSVQDDIQRRTNTIVVIKGRYQATGTPPDDQEGPLRLRIMPGNVGPDDMVKQRAVDAGATEVRRILQGSSTSRPLQPGTNAPPHDRISGFGGGGGGIGGGVQPMQAPVQMQHTISGQHGHSMPQASPAQHAPDMAHTVSLYVGVEAAPSFNLHQRLKGPGDSYLLHISSTSGATVTLRGRGSGLYDSPDHLHLFVSATNLKSFEDAKGLCVNLIDTVRAEHAKSLSAQQPIASQTPSYAPPQLPYQPGLPYPQPGRSNPTGASYQQAQAAYSQPGHSQTHAPRPGEQLSPHSPYTSQPSPYPPTSAYPLPSSYPPSASSAMPPSTYPPSMAPSSYPPSMPPASYPSSSGFRQGAPPAAAPVATPQSAGQHMQAVSPHGQGQGSPFQGAPSQHAPNQHPFISQQHGQQHDQQHGRQHSQQHPPASAYGPGANQQQQQQQQPLSASHSAPHFAPYGQQGLPVRPPGPSAGPQAQPAAAGYAQQAPGFGQQVPSYASPAAQMHMQPDYGPQRQPDVERGIQPMSGPVQQGVQRAQQGMSHQEMAQQAERKRRFTEQKRESQLQQGTLQQPNMPAYGLPQSPGASQFQQGSLPSKPTPLKSDVPPAPMGPPPPRAPAQLGMGSMGPPPPRTGRPQGAQVQLQPPVQGLVPYGDDD